MAIICGIKSAQGQQYAPRLGAESASHTVMQMEKKVQSSALSVQRMHKRTPRVENGTQMIGTAREGQGCT